MGFTKHQLAGFANGSVPDLIGADCRLLFVGINPGLWTVATQTHFCHPSNRFYPGLRRAGLIEFAVESSVGMTSEQRDSFVARGMGITNIVSRATARASELGRDELVAGATALTSLISGLSPIVTAISGVTAYRSAFAEPDAVIGHQPTPIGDSELWVIPNPSGLNAHETIETLAGWYRRVGTSAGLL